MQKKIFDKYLLYLGLYIILAAGLQLFVNSQFRSLPSVLFGGDAYYQRGAIEHISGGGGPWKSSSFLEGPAGYSPFYGFSVSLINKILDYSIDDAMLFCSVLFFIIGTVLWYILAQELFKKQIVSLIVAIAASMHMVIPIVKYTDFAIFCCVPLAWLVFFKYWEKRTLWWAIFIGVICGFSAWMHSVLFFGLLAFLLLLVCIYVLYAINRRSFEDVKKTVFHYAVMQGVAFIAAIPFIYSLFFRTGSYNGMFKWGALGFFTNYEELANVLVSVMPWFTSIFNSRFIPIEDCFIILCAMFLIVIKKQSKLDDFMRILFVGTALLISSFIVTVPLTGKFIPPSYVISIFGSGLRVLSIGYLLHYFRTKLMFMFVMLAFICVTVGNIYSPVLGIRNGEVWSKAGLLGRSSNWDIMAEYIKENTNVNQVILSTKEISFAINAMTGRKLVTNRWAQQNDPKMDFSSRDRDASIMLYAKENVVRKELFKKYKVDYLLWTKDWDTTMFKYRKDGSIESAFDPFILFYNKDDAKRLSSLAVSSVRRKTFVDPAFRGFLYTKFDLLIVTPRKQDEQEMPWHRKMDDLLVKVKELKTVDGTLDMILYKIKKDSS